MIACPSAAGGTGGGICGFPRQGYGVTLVRGGGGSRETDCRDWDRSDYGDGRGRGLPSTLTGQGVGVVAESSNRDVFGSRSADRVVPATAGRTSGGVRRRPSQRHAVALIDILLR